MARSTTSGLSLLHRDRTAIAPRNPLQNTTTAGTTQRGRRRSSPAGSPRFEGTSESVDICGAYRCRCGQPDRRPPRRGQQPKLVACAACPTSACCHPPRFTKVAGSSVAYQVIGDGPIDVIWVTSWFSHIDGRWQEPRWHRFWSNMSSWCRLILYDRRGSGASDAFPDGAHPTWEEWVEDLAAVMDAAGSQRAAVVASTDAGTVGALFAATFPERVSALVLVNSSARFLEAPDYPFGVTQELAESVIVAAERAWGNEALVDMVVPSMAHDHAYLEFWARYQRMVASPRTAGHQMRLQILTADIREILASINVPTLVLHRKSITMPIHTVEHGRYLADHIPGARFVELEGDDVVLPLGDQDPSSPRSRSS